MTAFKDLFGSHAHDYAKFRPTYPESLFDYLAAQGPARELAWDCGTGSGQAAAALARRFLSVVATDPSALQLESATTAPNLTYRVGGAQDSGIEAGTVDLVTVAQAFHWFPQSEFFKEVSRVAKTGAVLAVWAYSLARITDEVDAVVQKLYEPILGEYWEPERRLVDEGYARENFPFAELETPPFEMSAEWGLSHLLGYLSTWSSLQKYLKIHQTNPLVVLQPELEQAWGKEPVRKATWPLALRAFRVEK